MLTKRKLELDNGAERVGTIFEKVSDIGDVTDSELYGTFHDMITVGLEVVSLYITISFLCFFQTSLGQFPNKSACPFNCIYFLFYTQ